MSDDPFLRARLGAALLASILSVSVAGQAQIRGEFSGYVLDFPVYQRSGQEVAGLLGTDRDQFLNLTRLRLRPSLLLWDGGSLALEHEVTLQFQSSSLPEIQSPSAVSTQVTRLRWVPFSSRHFTFAHFVDRLYFRQNSANSSFILGRQQISWGTGRVWNPTDLFNPINPADFAKIEKDGADAASFTYYFGDFTDVQAVVNPASGFDRTNAAARFLTNIAGYDASIMGASVNGRYVAGADFAGNLFQAGIRGEGIVSAQREKIGDSYVRFVLGVDYQFTGALYGLLEYLFNGNGEADDSRYDLPRILSGDILTPGRHYLALDMRDQLGPLFTASVFFESNLSDGSGFAAPGISYSASENATMEIGALVSYGSARSEFSYYPLSLYLKTELYF